MNRAKEQAYFSWKNSAKIHISTSSGESILEYLKVNSPANRMFISRDLTRLSKRRRWHVAFGMTSEFRSWSYMVVWLDCPQDKAVKCKSCFWFGPFGQFICYDMNHISQQLVLQFKSIALITPMIGFEITLWGDDQILKIRFSNGWINHQL